MKRLVIEITGHILEGSRVRHWRSDHGRMISGIHLRDFSDVFVIHHYDGSVEDRSADSLCRDSFELCGPLVVGRSILDSVNIVPAWLERGEG